MTTKEKLIEFYKSRPNSYYTADDLSERLNCPKTEIIITLRDLDNYQIRYNYKERNFEHRIGDEKL